MEILLPILIVAYVIGVFLIGAAIYIVIEMNGILVKTVLTANDYVVIVLTVIFWPIMVPYNMIRTSVK